MVWGVLRMIRMVQLALFILKTHNILNHSKETAIVVQMRSNTKRLVTLPSCSFRSASQ